MRSSSIEPVVAAGQDEPVLGKSPTFRRSRRQSGASAGNPYKATGDRLERRLRSKPCTQPGQLAQDAADLPLRGRMDFDPVDTLIRTLMFESDAVVPPSILRVGCTQVRIKIETACQTARIGHPQSLSIGPRERREPRVPAELAAFSDSGLEARGSGHAAPEAYIATSRLARALNSVRPPHSVSIELSESASRSEISRTRPSERSK